MKNVVIKSIKKGDGPKIVELFDSLGVDTDEYGGFYYKEKGDWEYFYGVLNGRFQVVSVNTLFKEFFDDVEILELPELPSYVPYHEATLNQFKNLLIEKLGLDEQNMVWYNTVIKVKNQAHGKRVIEFFKSKGVHTNGLIGKVTEENSGELGHIYYGVINGEFDNYTLNCIENRNASPYVSKVKIIELPEEKTFPRKMLVWDYSELPRETIVLWENPFGKPEYKYVCVRPGFINAFENNEEYEVEIFHHAKEIDDTYTKKQELLDKANELIQKAEELKLKAKEL